jgi:hypothetical protein
MTRANQAYEAWGEDMHAKLSCRLNETRALIAQAQAAQAAYNAQAAAFTSAVNSWNAVAAAYNGQHGNAPASDRGRSREIGHN